MKVKCHYCGNKVEKYTGHVNRALKNGNKLYCNQKCFGLDRRSDKTMGERKAEKAAYDKKYRKKNIDWKTFQAAFTFVWDYQQNPEKYKKWRKRRSKAHNEYCRQLKYRKYKKKYDKKYRAQKLYGDYGDAALILFEIEGMIDKDRARFDKGCHNKTQQRRRLWKNLQRSISKTPSGTHSKGSKAVKSNTRTRMQLPAKRGKSSGRPTRRSK